jgi:hypothetical protein
MREIRMSGLMSEERKRTARAAPRLFSTLQQGVRYGWIADFPERPLPASPSRLQSGVPETAGGTLYYALGWFPRPNGDMARWRLLTGRVRFV